MDASVALMNQYAMISAQFPPLQTNPIPVNLSNPTTSTDANKTASTSASTSESTSASTSTTETVEKQTVNIEEKKTTASNVSDDEAGPSTSQKHNAIETLEIDGNIVTIEDIGQNDPSDSSDSISEVRRRRLERFEATKNQES